MPVESMKCPACGAPVSMSRGKRFSVCDFCGTQVKEQLSEAEFKNVEKNNEFSESIKAALLAIYKNLDAGAEYVPVFRTRADAIKPLIEDLLENQSNETINEEDNQ